VEEYLAELDSFDKFWKGVYGLMAPHYHKHDIWDYKKKDSLPLEHGYLQPEFHTTEPPLAPEHTSLTPVWERGMTSRTSVSCGGGIPGSALLPQVCCLLCLD
jgi:hypothetical protein